MTTPSPIKTKRPITLLGASLLLCLTALLSFAAPFLPRGGPSGQPPAGLSPQNGQPPSQGQAGTNRGQPPAQGGYPGPGGAQGMPGGAAAVMTYALPLRIAGGVVGGLWALTAALGLWRLKRWGMGLALVFAAIGLVAAGVALAGPLVGRTPWLMLVSAPTWQAIASLASAVLVSVLVLLPGSQKAYGVQKKERRVM